MFAFWANDASFTLELVAWDQSSSVLFNLSHLPLALSSSSVL